MDDINRSRTSEEDNVQSVLLPGRSNPKFEFQLSTQSKEPYENDSLDDSLVYNMRRSSSSETEEENWKKKIERGAYTEKVRIKSKSVTDLMVLTHIDCSESESETPQPSLDHRVNYKNVRLAPGHNLENASQVHGSEGNLLSVQDDFQAELRKLQEKHRDSLFFVPDKYSQKLRNEQVNNNLDIDSNICLGDSTSNERLIKELSSTSELTPVKQVYNVFNVTIDKLSPIHVVKLNEIINLEDTLEYGENRNFVSYEVPKLCDIIQNNSMVANILEDDYGASYNAAYQDEIEQLNQPSISEVKQSNLNREESIHNEDKIDITNNKSSPFENSNNACEESIETEKFQANSHIERNTFKETNNGVVKNEIDTKTEESHVDEKKSEMKVGNKENICVPDNQFICDESVLIDNVRLDIPDIDNDGNIVKDDNDIPTSDIEIRDELVICNESEEKNSNEKSVIEEETRIGVEYENKEIQLNCVNDRTENIEEIVMPQKECDEENKDIGTHLIMGKGKNIVAEDREISRNDENVSRGEVTSNIGIADSGINLDENFEKKKDNLRNDLECNVVERPLVISSGSEEVSKIEGSDMDDQFIKNHEDCDNVEIQSNVNISEGTEIQQISPVEDIEDHQVIYTDEVESIENEKCESENLPLPMLESAENVSLKNAESHEESPLNQADSLDTVEEEKIVEEDNLLILLNEQDKNTLEDLYVFQMGENLNSFEMNSQISDIDFSLPSERYRETIGDIEEESSSSDTEYEPTKQTHIEESNLKKEVIEKEIKKRENNKKDPIDINCQEDATLNAKPFEVPKLVDLIENDDILMDYIISNYESELFDDLSCDSSHKNKTEVIEKSDDKNNSREYPVVNFDLSNSQEAANPNPLTHLSAFSSLRTKPICSLELITSTPSKKSKDVDSEDLDESNNLNYSLETWDNFIGNAIDTRNTNDQTVVFESLNSEPQSMLFIDTEGMDLTVTPPNSDMEVSLEGAFLEDVYNNQTINIQEEDAVLNRTYDVEESELNKTFDISNVDSSFSMEECASDEQGELNVFNP